MSYANRNKNNNQFKIDHAWPGVCALCFDEIAEYNGSNSVGKPVITKILNKYKSYSLELDDGSNLVGAICRDCNNNLTEDDYDDLIASEIKGWKNELATCLKDKWTQEQKDKYAEKYYKLKFKKPEKEKKDKDKDK